MRNFLIICSLVIFTACSSNKKSESAPQEPSVPSIPVPVEPSVPADATIGEILLTTQTHNVTKVVWGNRGKAPIGMLKGMALVFARQVCNPNAIVANPNLGSSDIDAMAHYGIKPSSLAKVHAFMVGLAMRESSGKYCTGRDGSANNIQSDTAEGGILQTSYNSRAADPSLAPFFKNYDKKCYLEVFKEGAVCGTSYAKNWGTGADGLAFQKKVKECPAFAVDYAAITMRKLRKHYGPINRKEVLYHQDAVNLFEKIEAIVKSNPAVCSAL